MDEITEQQPKEPRIDRRRFNKGGSYPGAGRPLGLKGKLKRGLLSSEQAYLVEKVIRKVRIHGQLRRTLTTRGEIAANCIYMRALKGGAGAIRLCNRLAEVNSDGTKEELLEVLLKVSGYLMKRHDARYLTWLAAILPRQKRPRKKSIWGRINELGKPHKQDAGKESVPVSQIDIMPAKYQIPIPPQEPSRSNISEETFNKRMGRNRNRRI